MNTKFFQIGFTRLVNPLRSGLDSLSSLRLSKARNPRIPELRPSGFTLAEVLITLTILGVVATLVIPNVYQKYQRKITVTKVKKMYSQLTNAYDLYLVENKKLIDSNSHSAQSTKDFFDALIRPYFEIAYDAGIDVNKKIQIMGNNPVKKLDGTLADSGFGNKNYYTNNGNGNYYYGAMLKDGSVIFLRGPLNNTTSKPAIFYDVNGKKEPNTIGKDLFLFTYLEDRLGYNNFENGCINDNATGWGCTAWIIAKGNMDYLDCPDTLTWEKGKCD